MKKINSNGYGGKILGCGMLFVLAIPAGLKLIAWVCKYTVPAVYPGISIGIGSLILLFLVVLLAVELRQDARLHRYYSAQAGRKLSHNKGVFECQSCGNRKVKAGDRSCVICGCLFAEEGGNRMKDNETGISDLSKTLFIPLAVRAGEAGGANPVVEDKMAAKLLKQCGEEGAVTDGGGISAHGILARTAVLDREIGSMLEQSSHTVVINLGAGLDTRFYRLDDGTVRWYELDLPEVTDLRRRLLSEEERHRFVPGSVLDRIWTEKIECSAEDRVIIIAEGLLMYFTETDIVKILDILTKAFPKAELYCDVVHKYFVGKGISSEFRFGIAAVQEIERLHEGIQVVRSWSTGDLLKKRQPLLLRMLNIFPATRNRSRIIHLQWKGED